jgi:hypothetical protein
MSVIPSVNFEAIKAAGLDYLIDINPITGNQMYHAVGNDVLCMVEIMGGKEAVVTKLGVEEFEVENWIDNHYVPTRYAEKIQAMTGWSVWSIQEAPFGVKTGSICS